MMMPVIRQMPATLEHLPDTLALVRSLAEQAGLDPRQCWRLELAFEEVFVNLCQHAYPESQPGVVEVHIFPDSKRFVVNILDDGPAFDPATLPAPDLSAPLAARGQGGLGWFLTRQMVSELRCRREGKRNLVSLVMLSNDRGNPDGSSTSR